MRALPLLFLLAACGPGPKPVSLPEREPTPEVATTPYEDLFAAGASWIYTVEVQNEDDHRYEDVVTCVVGRVRPFDGGRISELSCDNDIGGAFDGAWVGDARGLWHLDYWPGDGETPELEPRAKILDAVPVAYDESFQDPEYDDYGEHHAVAREGEAWCWTRTYQAGDEGFHRMCFAGGGVVSGGIGWSGTESHDTTFELRD